MGALLLWISRSGDSFAAQDRALGAAAIPSPVDNLREIAFRCGRGEPLAPGQAAWLAAALEAFLSRRVRSLDEAFSVKYPRGGAPWWLEEAIRRRNAALRNLASLHYPEASPSARARFIRLAATRYASSCWLIDRERDEMPPNYANTRKEWLWIAFKSGAPMPIGDRHLRNIVRG